MSFIKHQTDIVPLIRYLDRVTLDTMSYPRYEVGVAAIRVPEFRKSVINMGSGHLIQCNMPHI